MKYDKNKVDECTLALLYLVMWKEGDWHRAWKSFDWDTMARLHEKGWIHNPKGKAKSIGVTNEGIQKAQSLFKELFGQSE
jgi:hypothetical protein